MDHGLFESPFPVITLEIPPTTNEHLPVVLLATEISDRAEYDLDIFSLNEGRWASHGFNITILKHDKEQFAHRDAPWLKKPSGVTGEEAASYAQRFLYFVALIHTKGIRVDKIPHGKTKLKGFTVTES